MPIRVKKLASALKHGMYSATTVLPTEDTTEFEQLHQDLIAELAPNGALEADIVANIVRLTWRKNNLPTLRHVTRKRESIRAGVYSAYLDVFAKTKDAESDSEASNAESVTDANAGEQEVKTRKQKASKTDRALDELLAAGDAATFDGLIQELEIEERLGAMIDRYLKRLLFLRRLKSISSPSVAVSNPTSPSSALLTVESPKAA